MVRKKEERSGWSEGRKDTEPFEGLGREGGEGGRKGGREERIGRRVSVGEG